MHDNLQTDNKVEQCPLLGEKQNSTEFYILPFQIW